SSTAQQQPPLPPPGTIGLQPVGARVPQLGERIDAAQTYRAMSSQINPQINLVPDRGAHLRAHLRNA
ncbi:MAG: hypothetical protein ACKPKO_22035, partial [Candidatus Fonsibacter sp.]